MRVVTEYNAETLIPLLLIPCAFHAADKRLRDRIKATAITLTLIYITLELKHLTAATENAYPPNHRINKWEMEAAEWMRHNTPPESTVYYTGEVPATIWKWFNAISDRRVVDVTKEGIYFEGVKLKTIKPDYIIFDYNHMFIPPETRNQHSLNMFNSEQKLANITEEVHSNEYTAIKKIL
jgi:hypothetical protein